LSVSRRDVFKLFAGIGFAATVSGVTGVWLTPVGPEVGELVIDKAVARIDLTGMPWMVRASAKIGNLEYEYVTLFEKNPETDLKQMQYFIDSAHLALKRCQASIAV